MQRVSWAVALPEEKLKHAGMTRAWHTAVVSNSLAKELRDKQGLKGANWRPQLQMLDELNPLYQMQATDQDIKEKSDAWKIEQRVALRRSRSAEEPAEPRVPQHLMGKEGTIMDSQGNDDASAGFVRVFFGPPSIKTSTHSGTLDSATADSEVQAADPESSFTWSVPLTSLQLSGFKYTEQANGQLKVGSFVFAPHVADPRLSTMRCGWLPERTPWCGKVGKVTQVEEQCVQLCLLGGVEAWWDIELFDASLTRCCHFGCQLQRIVATKPLVCDVCSWDMPIGAETNQCAEHDYDICQYCLGHPRLPPVGARVIYGPTWPGKPAPVGDGSEEGIVETELLDTGSHANSIGASEGREESADVQDVGLHSYFKVRWVKSGEVSYCRGPPFQDVTVACDDNSLGS